MCGLHNSNCADARGNLGHQASKDADQSSRMDQLSPLFAQFTLSARVFYSGALCGVANFDNTQGIGILHVLRRGRLRLVHPPEPAIEVTQPSLLFYRQPFAHRFEVDDASGADLVCAFIDFGSACANPLLRGLPDLLMVPMADLAGVQATLALLFDEAFAQRMGREAAIDRLVELFVVLLLRHAIEAQLMNSGVLAALANPQLAKVMTAMHAAPQQPWTVETLAAAAGMSRARFAASFHTTVGTTPMDYLTDWRVSVAQTLLRRGKPLKVVAPAVGYASTIALSRVFTKRVGMSAMQWLATLNQKTP